MNKMKIYKSLGILFGGLFIIILLLANFKQFKIEHNDSTLFSVLMFVCIVKVNQLKVKDLEKELHELKAEGITIASIEQAEHTTFLQHVPSLEFKKIALIFGTEVDGVDQEAINLSDHILEIPQFGTKHSLNVSVCAGVVLWEFAKRTLREPQDKLSDGPSRTSGTEGIVTI